MVGNGSVGKMQWAAYVLHALGKSCVVGIDWVSRMLQWIGAAFAWSAGISLLPGAATTKVKASSSLISIYIECELPM